MWLPLLLLTVLLVDAERPLRDSDEQSAFALSPSQLLLLLLKKQRQWQKRRPMERTLSESAPPPPPPPPIA